MQPLDIDRLEEKKSVPYFSPATVQTIKTNFNTIEHSSSGPILRRNDQISSNHASYKNLPIRSE